MNYRDKNWLYNQYINQKKSGYQIADICRMDADTIYYWLEKFGIDRRSRSEAIMGKNNPFFGETHTKKTKDKMSKSHSGKILTEEHKTKISISETGKICSEETRNKIRIANMGKSNPNWKNGASFEPYCYLFNDAKKEKIRNRDNRTCQLCGKSEILNGRKLDVHHINGDKMQGCGGKKWQLVSLCLSCNSKKDTVEKEFILMSNLYWRVR